MKLLVVEDDIGIASLISRGLEKAGYQVVVVRNGDIGLSQASSGQYQLAILDIMLPGRDGLAICRELRAAKNPIPILMLTARGTISDRVEGLEIGADDYLPKPFDFQELLARVRALLRREKVHRTKIVQIADLELDTERREVSRAGAKVILSRKEYDLLEALAVNEGQVLSREVLMNKIWMSDELMSNVVDATIKSLRKKIDEGQEKPLIHTMRGFGYSLSSHAPTG